MDALSAFFLYHQVNDTVQRNFDVLRHHNPKLNIIPLAQGCEAFLPGSFCDPSWKAPTSGYYDADLFFLHMLKKTGIPAHRVAWLDWDCYVNCDLRDFYAPMHRFDIHAPDVKEFPKHDWCWWKGHRDNLGELKHYSVGIVPLAGCLFRREFLKEAIDYPMPQNNWCELRFGSFARAYKFSVGKFPQKFKEEGNFIRYRPEWPAEERRAPGVYHPVKK